jgi:hypothetical protein
LIIIQYFTLTNLLAFTEKIHEAFSNNCLLDAIYTDFSKAFDLVNHSALIYKLACSGIRGDLLRWLDSYLRNRYKLKTSSGVPQGSHLGPSLFILFINDLSWLLQHVNVGMFADDLKIYKTSLTVPFFKKVLTP